MRSVSRRASQSPRGHPDGQPGPHGLGPEALGELAKATPSARFKQIHTWSRPASWAQRQTEAPRRLPSRRTDWNLWLGTVGPRAPYARATFRSLARLVGLGCGAMGRYGLPQHGSGLLDLQASGAPLRQAPWPRLRPGSRVIVVVESSNQVRPHAPAAEGRLADLVRRQDAAGISGVARSKLQDGQQRLHGRGIQDDSRWAALTRRNATHHRRWLQGSTDRRQDADSTGMKSTKTPRRARTNSASGEGRPWQDRAATKALSNTRPRFTQGNPAGLHRAVRFPRARVLWDNERSSSRFPRRTQWLSFKPREATP